MLFVGAPIATQWFRFPLALSLSLSLSHSLSPPIAFHIINSSPQRAHTHTHTISINHANALLKCLTHPSSANPYVLLGTPTQAGKLPSMMHPVNRTTFISSVANAVFYLHLKIGWLSRQPTSTAHPSSGSTDQRDAVPTPVQ